MDRGYHARVKNKLKKLPEYAEKSEEDLDKMVTNLTEFEPFRDKYDCFPVTVEATSKGYALEAIADGAGVEAQRLPHHIAKGKVEDRYENVCKLPVKLVLRIKPTEQAPVKIFDAQLDVALLIFDHIFEWNDSSLVIPKRVDLNTLPPVLMTPVLHKSEWSTYVSNQRSKVRAAVKSRSDKLHKKEINLLFQLTTRKDGLISSIIKTVIDYNRNKQYHERTCNNQHFIEDVTRAMGVPKLPEIGESLGKQLEQSRQLCIETLPRSEFADHADLDDFVRYYCESDDLSQLHIRDIEYLVGKYFHYHVRHWEQSHHPDQWTCQEEDCQLNNLEEQLEKLSLSGERKCLIL